MTKKTIGTLDVTAELPRVLLTEKMTCMPAVKKWVLKSEMKPKKKKKIEPTQEWMNKNWQQAKEKLDCRLTPMSAGLENN